MKTLSCFVCLMFVTLAIPARGDRPVVLIDQSFDYADVVPVIASAELEFVETALSGSTPIADVYWQAIDDFFVSEPTMIDRATFTFVAEKGFPPAMDYGLLFYREADNLDWPDDGIGPLYFADQVTLQGRIDEIKGYPRPHTIYEVTFEGIDLLLEPGQYWASAIPVTVDVGGGVWWGTSGAGKPLNGDGAYWRNLVFDSGVWLPAHEQGIGLEYPTDLAMTIEGTVLADPGIVAELLDFDVVAGEHIVGTLEQIEASDNDVIATRSERGLTTFEPNVMEMVIGAASPVEPADATTIDVTIESNMVNGQFMGEAKVRLRNWETDDFDQVAAYDIHSHEERIIIDDINAANYVRADDGRIDVSVRHVAMATFFEEGFEPHFDEVEVRVHER